MRLGADGRGLRLARKSRPCTRFSGRLVIGSGSTLGSKRAPQPRQGRGPPVRVRLPDALELLQLLHLWCGFAGLIQLHGLGGACSCCAGLNVPNAELRGPVAPWTSSTQPMACQKQRRGPGPAWRRQRCRPVHDGCVPSALRAQRLTWSAAASARRCATSAADCKAARACSRSGLKRSPRVGTPGHCRPAVLLNASSDAMSRLLATRR